MSKPHKGLFHLNRGRRLTPAKIEESDMYYQMEKRSHGSTWNAAIKIVDGLIDSLQDASGEYDWARLASLLGNTGSATLKEAELVWRMCGKAAKEHDVLTKKMMGLFLMWRFAHRDGWFAYVKDTGKYDAISEKEITITCYFRRK